MAIPPAPAPRTATVGRRRVRPGGRADRNGSRVAGWVTVVMGAHPSRPGLCRVRLAERVDGAVQGEPAVTGDDLAGDPGHRVDSVDRLGDVSGFSETAESSPPTHRLEPA